MCFFANIQLSFARRNGGRGAGREVDRFMLTARVFVDTIDEPFQQTALVLFRCYVSFCLRCSALDRCG